jgi:putative transposase
MDQHLIDGAGNSRNGYSSKTVLTGTGKIELSVPRDRQSSFDPQLIAKYQRRFPGFDDKIVSMYARGMSVREIQAHLRELYGIDASPDLISAGPTPYSMRSPNGRTVLWKPFIPWCSSTPSG